MAKKGTKERCAKGTAKGIIANAMKSHPTWNAKKISQNYPVGESTCHKYMKQIRDAEPPQEELKSQPWLVFAGVMAGIALMLLFIIAERGVQ